MIVYYLRDGVRREYADADPICASFMVGNPEDEPPTGSVADFSEGVRRQIMARCDRFIARDGETVYVEVERTRKAYVRRCTRLPEYETIEVPWDRERD